MRYGNISIALMAVIMLALMGCETDGKAAEVADPSAQYERGQTYYKKKNYTEAVKWFRKAAEQGFAPAQNDLGRMYFLGKDVWQDHAEAVKWYRKAAEQGLAEALHNLGLMYQYGYGVSADEVTALMLFKMAVAQGLNGSVKAVDMLTPKMTPADISKAERLARECADKNYKDCGF